MSVKGNKHIEINIGKACNNKCKFCLTAKSELWDIKFVSIAILNEKILYYFNQGYRSIGFIGGDISIHPDLFKIISKCKEVGFIDIHIVTNGMIFHDINLASRVVSSGLTRINFSIHCHIDTIEDDITQVPGSLKKKIKAIINFKTLFDQGLLRDQLSINIVLNKKNLNTILSTVIFFNIKYGIKDIRINFMKPVSVMQEYWNETVINYKESIPYLKSLIFFSEKYLVRITFDAIPPCIFYIINKKKYIYNINKYLGEYKDHIIDVDDINREEFLNRKDVIKNDERLKFTKCEKCKYFSICNGVRKNYAKIFGDDDIFPII